MFTNTEDWLIKIFSFVWGIKRLPVKTTITMKLITFSFGILFLMAHLGFVFAQGHNLPYPSQKVEPATSHSFNTLGGVISGSGGAVSQSLGQLVYTSEESASGSLAQGVQRPYRLASVEIPPSVPELNFSILPNPTDGFNGLGWAKLFGALLSRNSVLVDWMHNCWVKRRWFLG